MNKYAFELKKQRWMTLDSVVSRMAKWIPICFICWLGYLSIKALAGKSTLSQFGVWIATDLKINKVFSHIVTAMFGCGGVTYGYRERRLRQKNIERMGTQQIELEKLIDAGRSSSRLTKKGRTRPEDRL